MADDNYQVAYASLTKIPDTRFDHRTFAEGKQRFESAHSPRPSGGENDSGNASAGFDGHKQELRHETTEKVTTQTGAQRSPLLSLASEDACAPVMLRCNLNSPFLSLRTPTSIRFSIKFGRIIQT
jgi:hypothetical protein